MKENKLRVLLKRDEVEKLNTLPKEVLMDIFDEEELKDILYSRGFYDISVWYDDFLDENSSFFELGVKLPPPKHMKEIWGVLETNEDLNVIIARGHAKTTAILIWITWKLVYGMERKIMYIAEETLGKIGVGKIRRELEMNENIKDVFGELVPENSDDVKDKRLRKWTGTEIELLNGCELCTFTKGMALRGNRPSKIVIDDPQDKKDIKNKRIVDEFNEWLFTTVYGMLMPGGSMAILGTMIGKLCLVHYVKTVKKWKTIEYQACDENFENILRPEIWSKGALVERCEKMGTANFKQEYRGIAKNRDDSAVKDEWIQTYKQRPEKFDYIVMGHDPKKSLKQIGDYAGYCIIGVREVAGRRKFWILYSKGVRLSPMKQGELVKALYARYKFDAYIKEDNIETGITEEIMTKTSIPIVPVTASTDKYSRLQGVSPKIEFGDVYFREEGDEDLIDQLTAFPEGEFDDILDAFVWAMIGATEYATGTIHQLKRR